MLKEHREKLRQLNKEIAWQEIRIESASRDLKMEWRRLALLELKKERVFKDAERIINRSDV